MQKTCVRCGVEYETEDKRQKYCNRACYESARKTKKRSKPCEECGAPFIENYPGRRFCSKACRLAHGWIDRDPTKHSIFVCEWCETQFDHYTYRKRRFCCQHCANKFAAIQPKPSARRPESYITKPCDYCSKAYTVHKIFVEKRNTRFCSNVCRGAQRSIDIRGSNNPHWTGGTATLIDYGPNWHSQRRKAVRRDGHACQVCGYRSGGDTILDIHHIRKVKDLGGDWESANQLSNLIALCRTCHRLVEKGSVPCPTPTAA
ncbi:hypothetical protein LCGC14_0500320 [marine sediment metagenome]|uniref:HNH nuclease domain-containing protein n=1 Tax=marine sediment metagenome TaxID=412755 RepID=A0A0F9S958_9ZZZZ